MKRVKAKTVVLKVGILPPIEVFFSCPSCGNEITLLVNPETEEVLEIYADARDEETHKIQCGVCNTLIEWRISKQIVNPSRSPKNEI